MRFFSSVEKREGKNQREGLLPNLTVMRKAGLPVNMIAEVDVKWKRFHYSVWESGPQRMSQIEWKEVCYLTCTITTVKD